MQKLKKASLYRGELVFISGELVERYNKCLLMLGLSETTLASFYIDGIGWSPEVAEEKKSTYYLNNGDANPHCIIVTPLQKGLPVYNPFHSFDKDLMKLVFKTYGEKIQDITRDSAICVDFDQEIDVFYTPLDILKYRDITICFRLIDDLDQAKEEQLKLIETFHEENNFINENIHQQLLDSGKRYGDLRDRDLTLEKITFKTDSFYTKAFGGIYLLRDFLDPILVFEEEKTYKEAVKDTEYQVLMYHISHTELVEKLRDHLIIECDLEEKMTLKRYERIKKFIFSKYLKNTRHPIETILEDEMLFKSYLNKISIEARKEVMSVDRYLEKIKKDTKVQMHDIIDREIYFSLHKPHSSLGVKDQDLVWKLLVNIAPNDVLFLYWYEKEQFYKKYLNWSESMQNWVITTINKNI
ncbi:DUF6638 family protein [Tenacibaculum maritimum]|uniref:DUF6638 family protein n=1 Tax=Tenacibaculum maritimum TaxID=107401 RepID=UPI0012E4185B|nr:DUF6638 family protein [Tenacibaculum maritimum]MCD9562742.1 hypothetical protein [Tenacibaculum maritimum]MCD9565846.1 hypothetical protein [Tenacibaculum maritimum]MCD9579394.1 hypothetical protein [Tenacibaculum maritimum]MCD9582709.1 hypothetical protein [Tenacibaculum maritimum]MCD9596153.1 hypothetical protein [Tenacibaculum maritimum]